MLDMTISQALLAISTFLVKMAPALIGSGVYLLVDKTVGFDRNTVAFFLLSVLAGWAGGELLLEAWPLLKNKPVAVMWSVAIISAISAQVIKQVFENFGAMLKYAATTLWDKLLSVIPSFQELRDLFRKDKPNG